MRKLRFVVFSPSIISDLGNPQATTVRAMCQALIDLGHDVTHLEPRVNPFVTELLHTRGYGPVRSFNARYPLLRYRQYEPTGGFARRVWFSREIGTADVVVAYPGCGDEVMEEVIGLESPRMLAFFPGAERVGADLLDAWFQPAVVPVAASGERSGTLAVAYDTRPDIEAAQGVSSGRFSDGQWPYVPEVDLPDRYGTAERIRMSAEELTGMRLARALLAVASGATVDLIGPNGSVERTISDLPVANNAAIRAGQLSETITRVLDSRHLLQDQ